MFVSLYHAIYYQLFFKPIFKLWYRLTNTKFTIISILSVQFSCIKYNHDVLPSPPSISRTPMLSSWPHLLHYDLNVASDYQSLQAYLQTPLFGELLDDHLHPQEFLSLSLMVGANYSLLLVPIPFLVLHTPWAGSCIPMLLIASSKCECLPDLQTECCSVPHAFIPYFLDFHSSLSSPLQIPLELI